MNEAETPTPLPLEDVLRREIKTLRMLLFKPIRTYHAAHCRECAEGKGLIWEEGYNGGGVSRCKGCDELKPCRCFTAYAPNPDADIPAEIEAALSELERPTPVGWPDPRPMEEAPNVEGVDILIVEPDGMGIGFWDEEREEYVNGDGFPWMFAIGWWPLPTPPVVKTEGH